MTIRFTSANYLRLRLFPSTQSEVTSYQVIVFSDWKRHDCIREHFLLNSLASGSLLAPCHISYHCSSVLSAASRSIEWVNGLIYLQKGSHKSTWVWSRRFRINSDSPPVFKSLIFLINVNLRDLYSVSFPAC